MKNRVLNIKLVQVVKKFFFFTICLALFFNCVEEIEINEQDFDTVLVVKAILTDEYKNQQVELTLANKLNTNDTIYETDAIVTIVDSSLKTYAFTEKTDGFYESNLPFKAELGKQYSLRIKTSDGELYESIPEETQGINDIDEISAKAGTDFYGEEGITISVKSKSSDKNAKYYRYTYSETYKIIAPYYSLYDLEIVSDVYPFRIRKVFTNVDREICYNTNKSNTIIQTETNSLSENIAIHPIRFIKKNDSIMAHRYSIEVKQYVQSYEAYTYLKTLSKLSNTENVFSQSQQGFLQGNITSTTNTKKAIGFFEVSSTSKKRIFFNLKDVLPDHFINTRKSCDTYAPILTEFFLDGKGVLIPNTDYSPLVDAIKAGLIYYEDNAHRNELKPGIYKMVQKRCGDCRVYGTNIKPNFWID